MSFAAIQNQAQVVGLLQRSAGRNRLAHAYLFTGGDANLLEGVARSLAKLLNCLAPVRDAHGNPDSCGRCAGCRRVEEEAHPDVMWVRPESKLRLIRVAQVREVLRTLNLTPTEGRWKVAILSGAERMNDQAANALLKTLEEPPGQAVLILLSQQPQRLLETVVSRCLRLRFAGSALQGVPDADAAEWLKEFAGAVGAGSATVLQRYQLLGKLLGRLAGLKQRIETEMQHRSPLDSEADVEKELKDKWEAELAAAVESDYRRQRADFLGALEWLFRDVWLLTIQADESLLALPGLNVELARLARRFTPGQALENLRRLARLGRLLETNAQEALVLEVGLLKLHL